jgi:hypothetical protein
MSIGGGSSKPDHSSTSSPFGSSGMTPNALLSYTTGVMSSASASTTSYMLGGGGGSGSGSGSGGGGRNSSADDGVNAGVKFGDSAPQDKKTMMLFVVGGLSYLEIAALRFLSNDVTFPYRIMIATTKLINGSTLVRGLQQFLE